MNEKLITLIESAYKLAQKANDDLEIRAVANQACGACCYDYLLTDDDTAIKVWCSKWKEKFEALLKNNT